jgi:proliferating cell nuclear antigen PCNA
MEFAPSDSSAFRSAIEALKEFLPEAQLRVTTTGVRINGMDRAHVGFVDYELARGDCKTLKVAVPQTIGLNLVNLAKVLSNVGAGDTLRFSLVQGADRLIVNYSNDKIGKKAVYEIPLMMINEDAVELPELSYGAKVVAKTSDIVGVVKEVGAFGDALVLTLNPDGFHMESTGDMGSAKQTLENTDDRDMELTEDSVSSTFATKYLSGILKGGASLASTMTLEFDSSAQPLRASFNYGTASYFIAYLAPKITE